MSIKLIAFLDNLREEDGHSIFDPYSLLETNDFSEETAECFLLIALEIQSEYIAKEIECMGDRARRLQACKFLKKFREDEKFKQEAINKFIEIAKIVYYENANEENEDETCSN